MVDKCLEYLQDVNSVVLYATEDGYPMYQRRGFVMKRNIAFYSLVATEEITNKTVVNSSQTFELFSFDNDMMECLVNYDTQIHTCSREKFLKAFLKPDKVTTIVVLEEGSIMGYGCVDKMHGSFYCIGPVYANRYEVAHALLNKLIQSVPNNANVFFFAYENNETFTYNVIIILIATLNVQ